MEFKLLTMNEVCDEQSLMFHFSVPEPLTCELKIWKRISHWVKDLGIGKTAFSFKG